MVFFQHPNTLSNKNSDIRKSVLKLPIFSHYITFPGSRVSQNDCRMWNTSSKYKNVCAEHMKFSHKKIKENSVVTHKAIQKYVHPHICISTISLCYLHNL
jgi:hypothetical protein